MEWSPPAAFMSSLWVWRGAGPTGRQQSVADPSFGRLASEPVLEPVQAAREGDLGGWLAARLDVAAIDPDRWGAGEAGTLGRCLVADQAAAELGVDAQVRADPLHER
jgi:hypothetical protein